MTKKLKLALKTNIAMLALSAVFGVIGGASTLGLIVIFDLLIKLLWQDWLGYNIEDPSSGYAQLVILVLIGVLIGWFSKKYGPVRGDLETIIKDTLEKGVTNWRLAFKNVGIGFLSIGSGASLGPEAPASMLNAGVASFIADKRKLSAKIGAILNVSAVSGMIGSILSSPFVATAMFVEFSKDKISQLTETISYTFVAGSFGIATFFLILNKTTAEGFGLPALQGAPTNVDLLMAFVFGFLGGSFTVLTGLLMNFLEPLFKKLDNKLVIRSVTGATIAGLIALALPITMFSGQNTVGTLISDSASLGAGLLMLIAIAKLVATSTLIRTGFFGGPIFPALFAGVALGLALNTMFNSPAAVAISATITGILIVSIKKPLSAAILAIAITGLSNATIVALAASAGLVIVLALDNINKPEAR